MANFLSGFWMVCNKMAAKAIWKPDPKSVLKMTIWIRDSPVIGGSLYWFLEIFNHSISGRVLKSLDHFLHKIENIMYKTV
jgi:hypothetical protein